MMIGWQAWCVDASGIKKFSSADTNFADITPDSVLGVVVFYDELAPSGDHTRFILTGHDYYFIAMGLNGEFIGSDVDVRERDVPADIKTRYPDAIIQRGIWTDDETMKQVEQEIGLSKWQ